MAFYDLELDELYSYRPDIQRPDDFIDFWRRSVEESRAYPLKPRFEAASHPFPLFDIYDLSYSGFAGQRIRGWYIRPKGAEGLPLVVSYIGYGGGRGLAGERLDFAAAGYGMLIMDSRGQGASWSVGATPDPDGGGPQIPGMMSRGIEDPEGYYYRRIFIDALRAVEAAGCAPGADPSRLFLSGGSQGGALTIAASGLTDLCGLPEDQPLPLAAFPEVPFLCHIRRATGLVETEPYAELARYCASHRDRVEQVFHTLSYFDCVHFAALSRRPALFSVGLMDTICPPSTVFAAYNAWAGEKEIAVYEFNNHEGGDWHYRCRQLDRIAEHLDSLQR